MTAEQAERQVQKIEARVNNAARLYHSLGDFINKREVLRTAKLAVRKTIYCPMCMFGFEAWILTKRAKAEFRR